MYTLFSHKAIGLVHEILILIGYAPSPKIISIICSSNDMSVLYVCRPAI